MIYAKLKYIVGGTFWLGVICISHCLYFANGISTSCSALFHVGSGQLEDVSEQFDS